MHTVLANMDFDHLRPKIKVTYDFVQNMNQYHDHKYRPGTDTGPFH